jgi:predicted Fe-Mo cluster-binding NifX family protein
LVGGLGLRIEATASVEIKAIATVAATDVPAPVRVAVSAHAASLEAAVAPRFGRAPGFLIVEAKTMDFEYVANGVSPDRTSGFGVDAAALIANAGVTVLLTGFVGAKAMRALAQAGIQVADGLGALTAREAVECLVRGEITPILPEDVATGRANAPPDRETELRGHVMDGLIAFPTNAPGGRDASLSAHFASCACFTLVEISDGGATNATVLPAPAREDGGCAERVRRLAQHGVRAVVVSSISGQALAELQQTGIAVWRDQSQRPVAALVEAMKRGQIPQLGSGFARDSLRPGREARRLRAWASRATRSAAT